MITNRHVILSKHFANVARIRLHSDEHDLRENQYHDLNLYDERGRKRWVEPNPISADIVGIPLEDDFHRKGYYFKNFNAINLLPNNIRLHVGEDVIVMGYPLGIFDDTHNLPISRNGIIASAYPIPFKRNQFFLVDSYLEEGTSGSPVITKFKESWRMIDGSKPPVGFSFFLLGVNSATFPVEEGEPPAELNAVYFASIIESMTGPLS